MDIIAVIDLVRDTLEKHGDRATNKHFGEPDDWSIVIKDIKALGSCHIRDKEITISSHHIENHKESAVRDTILHECAHALAGVEISRGGRRMAHGKLFRRWASIVGANPKAKTEIDNLHDEGASVETMFRDKKYYVVAVLDGKMEIVSGCSRKLKNLERKMIPKREETVGHLWHVPVPVYAKHKGNVEVLKRHLFR